MTPVDLERRSDVEYVWKHLLESMPRPKQVLGWRVDSTSSRRFTRIMAVDPDQAIDRIKDVIYTATNIHGAFQIYDRIPPAVDIAVAEMKSAAKVRLGERHWQLQLGLDLKEIAVATQPFQSSVWDRVVLLWKHNDRERPEGLLAEGGRLEEARVRPSGTMLAQVTFSAVKLLV